MRDPTGSRNAKSDAAPAFEKAAAPEGGCTSGAPSHLRAKELPMRLSKISLVSILLSALTGCVATSGESVDAQATDDGSPIAVPALRGSVANVSPRARSARMSSRATGETSLGSRGALARQAAGGKLSRISGSAPATIGASDTCPGEQLLVDFGAAVTIADTSTASSSDNVAPWCVEATGTPDRVYQLEVAQPGVLHVDVTGTNGFVPAVELRESCSTPSNSDRCFSGAVSAKFQVEPGTYWLAIDGTGDGEFAASVELVPPACGDGVLSGTESCDDGNSQTGDGCNSDCHFDVLEDTADTCDGEPITFDADETAQVVGLTTARADDYVGTCAGSTGGKDVVFSFVAPSTGTLTADVGRTALGDDACMVDPYGSSCFDRVLYVREGTCGDGAEIGCSDDEMDGAAIEHVSVPVTEGQTYYVFVDGYDAEFYSYGTFVLDLKITH
jgi:cysteine-rich repeat protein